MSKNVQAALSAGHYNVRCFDPNGNLKWEDGFDNMVVDEGLNHILEVVLANETAAVTTWYVGLLGATPSPAAGWVAADLAAVDFVAYDEGTLPAWVPAAVAAKSVANSVTSADFTINGGAGTVGGAFLISTSAKAIPAGVLYSAGAFTAGNKSVGTGDTLQVTATFTQADA